MAWIKIISPNEAEGALRESYEKVGAARGQVSNIIEVHSVNPAAMEAHLKLYRTLMFGPSTLTRKDRELIAVAVSVANHCHY